MKLEKEFLAELMSTIGHPGKPLDEGLQAEMETAFGADFSDVQVFESILPYSISALAFTFGSNIYCAPGLYEAASPRGRYLIAHELVHLLQQRAGRIVPRGEGLIQIISDSAMETEARQLGQCACQPGAQNLMATRSAAPSMQGIRYIQTIDEIPVWANRTVRGNTVHVLVSNTALLTHNNMIGGTGPNSAITPPGFVGGDCPHHHQRGHLIGNKLGGTGDSINNLVTLTEGTNHPFMYEYEQAIYMYVRTNLNTTFIYQVEAHYDENKYERVQRAVPLSGSNFGAAGNPYCDFPCPSHLLIYFKHAVNNTFPLAHMIPIGSNFNNGAVIMNGIYKLHQPSTRHIPGQCWAVTP